MNTTTTEEIFSRKVILSQTDDFGSICQNLHNSLGVTFCPYCRFSHSFLREKKWNFFISERGKLAKRLRTYYKQTGINIDPQTLSVLMNRIKPVFCDRVFNFTVDQNFLYTSGEYADSGSCFWNPTHYKTTRKYLMIAGAYKLIIQDDKNRVGRAWVLPDHMHTATGCYIICNVYHPVYNLHDLASAFAAAGLHTAIMYDLFSVEHGSFYINRGTILVVSPDELDIPDRGITIYGDGDIRPVCHYGSDLLDSGQRESGCMNTATITINDVSYCEEHRHFARFPCNDCEVLCDYDDMYITANGSKVCEYCYLRNYCSECGQELGACKMPDFSAWFVCRTDNDQYHVTIRQRCEIEDTCQSLWSQLSNYVRELLNGRVLSVRVHNDAMEIDICDYGHPANDFGSVVIDLDDHPALVTELIYAYQDVFRGSFVHNSSEIFNCIMDILRGES